MVADEQGPALVQVVPSALGLAGLGARAQSAGRAGHCGAAALHWLLTAG
jgi:hypothetical protein